MRFDYIELLNYRPYLKEKIFFGKDEIHQNFTIIQGPNGAGKSSLLNAVTWCLYDEEIHLKERLKGLPIFNTEIFDAASHGEIVEVRVEIQLIDKEGLKHNFVRSLKFRKGKDGKEQRVPDPNSKEKDGSTFEYWRQENGQSVSLSEPRYYLEQIMPSNIKEYFFFDGERLDDYFREASGSRIQDAVFDISQIAIIDKASKRLAAKKRTLLQEHAHDLDPEEDKIRSQIEYCEKEIETYNKELEKAKGDKLKADELEKEYSKILKDHPDTTELEEKRLIKEKEINRIAENIKYLEEQKLASLLKASFSILASDAMNKAKDLIDRGISDGLYPPDARKDFIEGLLEKNRCICGVDLVASSECRKNVEELLRRISTSSDITNEIISMQSNVRAKMDLINGFDEEQVSLSLKIKVREEEFDSSKRELERIVKEIGLSPSEKIKKIKDSLMRVKEIREDAIARIGKYQEKIANAEKMRDVLNRKLDKLLHQKEKHRKLSQINNFLNTAIDALTGIKEDIMKEVREKIEENTRKQFFSLIWNPEAFKDVVIDEGYNISIVHASGREGIGTLSAGQRQVLALSFMAALKTVSGFDMPIIIDTPLGRISREPKINIARKLPAYLEGTQVTMLVTEEEYTPEVREKLRGRVGKEYRIILQSATSAEVVAYG
jgi:DNA sulfur modification protein DndD